MSENNSTTLTDEFKDHGVKYGLSKFEYDLYHDEDDIIESVFRVKHISLPNKGERWKIFKDGKIIFVVEGAKVSKKEKEFLKTVAGVNFMLAQARTGIKSLNKFRTEIKKIIVKPDKKSK